MNKQLKVGIQIESEHRHTYDLIKAFVEKHHKMPPREMMYTDIAKDHLQENKNYYKRLNKCKL